MVIPHKAAPATSHDDVQLEEALGEHLRWSVGVKSVLHTGRSQFQTCEMVDSVPFGKV